ncbi:MAG: ABC transporter ATP-binding protein [Nannocystis sp.]|nr:ABC transporter ATP-binding protein [Nannocystis sp.]
MIEVEGLTFSYHGAARATVQDVSFSAPKGSIFGVLGPSGAGKSTLQKVMIKLLPLQVGAIRYGGRPLAALGREFFADVGVSFEQPNLFPRLSGRENLTCLLGLYDREHDDPAALLAALGLGAAADQPAGEYSKGMKQRLVFLRSLIHRPSLLFLDEPTSGLDPATAELVKQMIRDRAASGVTVILTTHDMTLADQLCDTVAFLHDGSIAAMASPRALKLRFGERAVRVERRIDGRLTQEVFGLEAPEEQARLAEALRSPGIETLHSLEATLEQVFLKVTGRALT